MSPSEESRSHELVIIRRRRESRGGHQGGVWKIAYADFMTAMMAFFLVMWLINATDENKLVQISNYFDPDRATRIAEDREDAADERIEQPRPRKRRAPRRRAERETKADTAEEKEKEDEKEKPRKMQDKAPSSPTFTASCPGWPRPPGGQNAAAVLGGKDGGARFAGGAGLPRPVRPGFP